MAGGRSDKAAESLRVWANMTDESGVQSIEMNRMDPAPIPPVAVADHSDVEIRIDHDASAESGLERVINYFTSLVGIRVRIVD